MSARILSSVARIGDSGGALFPWFRLHQRLCQQKSIPGARGLNGRDAVAGGKRGEEEREGEQQLKIPKRSGATAAVGAVGRREGEGREGGRSIKILLA